MSDLDQYFIQKQQNEFDERMADINNDINAGIEVISQLIPFILKEYEYIRPDCHSNVVIDRTEYFCWFFPIWNGGYIYLLLDGRMYYYHKLKFCMLDMKKRDLSYTSERWLGDNYLSVARYFIDIASSFNGLGIVPKKLIKDLRKEINYGIKEGCYIATAVYGSYEAPEVLALRKFRDEILGTTLFGKVIVKIYYLISPSIAKRMKNTSAITLLTRKLLDKIVSKLINKGSC